MKYKLIDSHLHYLNFLQKTNGFKTLLKEMDKNNVEKAIIFGMAHIKMWDDKTKVQPAYYLTNDSRCYYFSATDHYLANDYLKLSANKKKRFIPLICGLNCNDKNAHEIIERLLNTYPGVFKGIGELMYRHDDLSALTYGEIPTPNMEATNKICKVALKHNLPILIHHNISAVNNEEPIYLFELQQMLKNNPKNKIIWAHCGWSRRLNVKNLDVIVDKMLSANKNLYVDISWIVLEEVISNNLNKWIKLIKKHNKKFLIGSDIVGKWDKYPYEITKYYKLLDKLDENTRKNICKNNVELLYK